MSSSASGCGYATRLGCFTVIRPCAPRTRHEAPSTKRGAKHRSMSVVRPPGGSTFTVRLLLLRQMEGIPPACAEQFDVDQGGIIGYRAV